MEEEQSNLRTYKERFVISVANDAKIDFHAFQVRVSAMTTVYLKHR